jgi:hypothetical protein
MRIELPELPYPLDALAPDHGAMSPEELGRLLNLLLEAERAGARLLAAYLDELPAGTGRGLAPYFLIRRQERAAGDARFASREHRSLRTTAGLTTRRKACTLTPT